MESDLTFQKVGDDKRPTYTTEFEATDACAVHIERETVDALVISQRSSSTGQYLTAESFNSRQNIDIVLVSDFYPMNWKITSYSPVTMAKLND